MGVLACLTAPVWHGVPTFVHATCSPPLPPFPCPPSFSPPSLTSLLHCPPSPPPPLPAGGAPPQPLLHARALPGGVAGAWRAVGGRRRQPGAVPRGGPRDGGRGAGRRHFPQNKRHIHTLKPYTARYEAEQNCCTYDGRSPYLVNMGMGPIIRFPYKYGPTARVSRMSYGVQPAPCRSPRARWPQHIGGVSGPAFGAARTT